MTTINLERFSIPQEGIAPIVNGWGKWGGRKVIANIENGWYKLVLGNQVSVGRKASPLEIEESLVKTKKHRGLPLGGEVVPWNFENIFDKGYAGTVEINFLDLPAWEVVKFARWEDGRFYFAGVDMSAKRTILNSVKENFEKNEGIDAIKGLTPELRYYFLLLSLQRQSYQQLKELEKMKLSEAEKQKRLEEFKNTFAGRLQHVIGEAGGKLIRFAKQGANKYSVTWKVGRQKVISIIKDDMRIYSLGYCAEGEDKKHTMSSAILLAKIFQKEKPLYITRE